MIGQGTILVDLNRHGFVEERQNKMHDKYNLGGLRQNTYKHTNPQKEIKETLKADKRR
ncbi:hypothetical protein AGMMS50233_07140 [Endomicrobiia bacterium]|nr:hypothetical protein AGMMS50233_07140 [Endomicrobiia bacterium]